MENKKVQSLLGTGFLAASLVVYSMVTVFAKCASAEAFLSFRFILFYGLEFLALAVYAVLWQQVLKRMKLMTAVSCKGFVVIIGLLWSVLFFGEHISWQNVAGSIVIIIGVWMVASDGN